MKNLSTKDMILISMFASLTAIGAFIKIPIPPVPVSLQFLFCAYSGMLLGSKKGMTSQLIYVGIGLLGVPVFTKGGGLSYIFQPTFGYLIGFILCSFIIGKLTENNPNQKLIFRFLSVLVGLAVVYAIGVSYLYFMWNHLNDSQIGWQTAAKWGFTPFIIPDIIWSFIVAISSYKILPVVNKAR
ncbi:biotin transporter BioY [Helicovermis profundi]|uniref:Biotin transporter n=1 Tax=Helicovermis profundi TaxID=3065157 RepID=A0AAU9EVH3_9FIRM|nr:biotin transporter BioY [Clostridia bacterium S502]